MAANRLFACILALAAASCQSGGDSRSDTRDRQLEEALETQDKQLQIEDYARTLPSVEAASAYLRPDSIVVKLRLKPGASVSSDEQEKLNRFTTELTGIPRSGIAIWVPQSSVPGRDK